MNKHRGVVVPMVTPVTPGGELDERAVCRIVDHMVEGGVDGIFILGTTGEGASVPARIGRRLVEIAIGHIRRRALAYVGVGSNCLAHSVEAAAAAFQCGADAVVAHLPSYFPLQPDEMFEYYSLLAARVGGALLLYNIPSTTHMSIPVEVIARLSDTPGIIGFKDSESSDGRVDAVAGKLGGKEKFSLFVGSTALSAKGLSLGMHGLVPGSGNLDPQLWSDLYRTALSGDWRRVERLQSEANRLDLILRGDGSVGQYISALKGAMSVRGLCGPAVLPPLRPQTPQGMDLIRRELHALNSSTRWPDAGSKGTT